MGNYMSCTFIPRPPSILGTRPKALRVLLPGGEIRLFRCPVAVAELMLECPGFFVADSSSLHMGRRFSPLGADQLLQLGNVYVMFPIKRANSVVMAADMAAVFMASSSASKRISAARVGALPDGAETEAVPVMRSLHEPEIGDGAAGAFLVAAPEFAHRLASCRSKKPSLETIKEEPAVRVRGRSR